MNRDEMSNFYRGPSIDISCQISDQLALRFQRRRLKCEKLTDDGRQVMAKADSAYIAAANYYNYVSILKQAQNKFNKFKYKKTFTIYKKEKKYMVRFFFNSFLSYYFLQMNGQDLIIHRLLPTKSHVSQNQKKMMTFQSLLVTVSL